VSAPDGRIYLSPPHLTGDELPLLREAVESNWIAPLGPHVDAFEEALAAAVGSPHAAALSSGTAALHLALRLSGVGPGDEVLVSTLTFAASVYPILYLGATPVFVDAERESWNLDPELVARAVEERVRRGRAPKAIIAVHLYGQTASLAPLLRTAEHHGIPLIEDAAEALGGSYGERAAGSIGRFGIFSFNGNKMITTSGGGMLVSADGEAVARARKLASQAREPAAHYEHAELGYNYRLSNLLAAVGRAQLRQLDARVAARRRIAERYMTSLEDLPGVGWMPEAPWGRHARWLSVMTIDTEEVGVTPEEIRLALEAENIEARPVWKPMHLQPAFRGAPTFGGGVAEALFRGGLCLPSGSSLSEAEQERVVGVIRQVVERA